MNLAETNSWIGIDCYLPPCIEGVWEEGAMYEDTAKACRMVALYLKHVINESFSNKGTSETPFHSWLEGDPEFPGSENLKRFFAWNKRCENPIDDRKISEIVYRVAENNRKTITCGEIQKAEGVGCYCVIEDCEREDRSKDGAEEKIAPKSIGSEYLTSAGNAERLIRLHKDHMRFCHTNGQWYLWDGSRWGKDDDGGAIRRSMEAVKELYRYAWETDDPQKRQSRVRWATKSDCMAGYREILEICKNKHPMTSTLDLFDNDPWMLNCSNGTLDLQSQEFRKPDPLNYITKSISTKYDPECECPLWKAFLKDIFRDDKDNPYDELISFVQQAVGYSLTGSMAEQMFFFCYGGGANGKSVFLAVIRELMGDYAKQTDFNTFLTQKNESVRNDIAALAGGRFITASEPESGKSLAMSLLKAWTGGDPITARFLHQEFFTFQPVGKLWFAANTRPAITERNMGAWRRVCMIPFNVSIPPKMQDLDLEEKILKELPGILNWALDGLKKYLDVGKLVLPNCVTDANKLYKKEFDSISSFIDGCIEINNNSTILGRELYEAYEKFCEEMGYRPASKQKFNREIESEPGVMKIDSRNVVKWLGINLLGEGIETVSNVSNVSRNLGFSYTKEILEKKREITSHYSHYSQLQNLNEDDPTPDEVLIDMEMHDMPIHEDNLEMECNLKDVAEAREHLKRRGWTPIGGGYWKPPSRM